MKGKVWIIVAVAVILALGAGTITAQNILGGNTNRDFESAAPEVLNEEGIMIGRIDNHSVEIEVNGEARVFGLSEELREMAFAEGPISFNYYVDKNGRSIITEADWTKDEGGAVQKSEGVFNGLVDSHTVEIEVEGQPQSFGLDEGISFVGIKEGEPVFIAYREIGGRLVIVKVERII